MRFLSLFMVAVFSVSGVVAKPTPPPEGFTALFNGRDLSGWWGLATENPAKWMALPAEELEAKQKASLADIKRHWRVKKGALVNDGAGLYLTTLKNYADFELRLEYTTVPRADSGIYLRGIPQVQIWDSTEKKKFRIGADKGSGGLWNNKKSLEGKDPLVLADKPFGKWNTMRILMVGERVTVELNGKLVVDHARLDNYFNPDLPIPRTGPIQLQTHGGKIGWRNVFIREIGGDEANEILASKNDNGFSPLFNGADLKGWKGALNSYQVLNDTLACIQGKSGILYTQKEYSDFTVRFEFKLPPGANNGLAIRYPGKGDTAYVGMCELQVLDDTAGRYSKLDPRQYHGSIYGMVAPKRGFLRPVGEWNFQKVEVRGSTIKVELNGTLIVDADVSTITEFAKDKAHPGKDRTKGHFGFAGHGSPVAFRAVSIKELD